MVREDYDLVIIGGGPGGLSAGIYGGRARLKTLILEKSEVGGRAHTTREIVNYPGINNMTGPELSEKMEEHAKGFGVNIRKQNVKTVDRYPNSWLNGDEGYYFNIFSYSIAHFSKAFSTGKNFTPISVKEYSTLGGTSLYISRCITLYSSSILSSFVKFACVTCGIFLLSSPNLKVPWLKKNTITMVHFPRTILCTLDIGQFST